MDFQPTQEHLMLSNMIGKFIENDYHLKDRIFAGNSELGYNENTYKTLAELGIVGALFPEGVGGFGGTGYDISTVFEALGKGLVNEPLVDSALASGYILAATGQDALIEKLISGELRVALALIENGADYDWELPSKIAQKIIAIRIPFLAVSGVLAAAHLWKNPGSMNVQAAIKNQTRTY